MFIYIPLHTVTYRYIPSQNMDAFLAALFGLANDPSTEIRKSLCQAVVMLLEVGLEKLMPHMADVVQVPCRPWRSQWSGIMNVVVVVISCRR